MNWLNEPRKWRSSGDLLLVDAAPQTDFWRKTHDGGIRDHGHFWFRSLEGDFSAAVEVHGEFRSQYDQAGLMARVDPRTWLKCGIEYVDGICWASAVVTRDWSDWSRVPLAGSSSTWWRLTRHAQTFEVEYSLDGEEFRQFRQAHLTESPLVDVGLMACSPLGDGFAARFANFAVRETPRGKR